MAKMSLFNLSLREAPQKLYATYLEKKPTGHLWKENPLTGFQGGVGPVLKIAAMRLSSVSPS